jgi:hypothetical protein
VDEFNLLLNNLVAAYLSLLGADHLFLSLVPLAMGTGLAVTWAYHKFSDQNAMSRTKKKLQAHLLEFRLFGDEPALLWRSYGSVLILSAQYCALSCRALLVLALPLFLLLTHLDVFYGFRPLRPGDASVLTIRMRHPIDPAFDRVRLDAPAEIKIETPAVRVFEQGQVSWRIRPEGEFSGAVSIRAGAEEIRKEVRAGNIVAPVSVCRFCSALATIQHPGEARLISNIADWVSVEYPAALMGPAALRFHWLIWFSLISLLSAWGLGKTFGVTY